MSRNGYVGSNFLDFYLDDEESLKSFSANCDKHSVNRFWFQNGFSSIIEDDEPTVIRVGCINHERTSKEIRSRLDSALYNLRKSVQHNLKDTSVTTADALRLILGAHPLYLQKGNPLWVWLVLNIFIDAALPPPAWVWYYLGEASTDIVSAANNLKIAAKGRTTNSVLAALELEARSGRKMLGQLSNDLFKFKKAIRVHKLINSGTQPRKLMEACREVAKEFRAGSRVSEREEKSQKHSVRKAYVFWFKEYEARFKELGGPEPYTYRSKDRSVHLSSRHP